MPKIEESSPVVGAYIEDLRGEEGENKNPWTMLEELAGDMSAYTVGDDGMYYYRQGAAMTRFQQLAKEARANGDTAKANYYRDWMRQTLEDNPIDISQEDFSRLSDEGKMRFYELSGRQAQINGDKETAKEWRRRYDTLNALVKKHAEPSKIEDESLEVYGPDTYLVDRSARNQEIIKKAGKDAESIIGPAYASICEEVPGLRCVKIVDDDIECNAHFSSTDGQNIVPVVHFNLSNIDTYIRGDKDKLSDEDRAHIDSQMLLLKEIALQTGAKPRDVLSNRNLVATFVFMHELGHAYDFLKNDLGVGAEEMKKGGISQQAFDQAQRKTAYEWNQEDLKTPFPKLLKEKPRKDASGKITAEEQNRVDEINSRRMRRLRGRFEAMGIDLSDPDALRVAAAKAYRRKPSETFADNFARKYISQHRDEFFGEGPDKIPTTTGKTWNMAPENVDVLGAFAGKNVIFTELSKNGDGERIDGFLLRNLKIGNEVELNLNGDPNDDRDENTQSLPKIKRVGIHPILQEKEINGRRIQKTVNKIFIQTEDGRTFSMASGQREPQEIDESPENLMELLRLEDGTSIQLLRLRTKGENEGYNGEGEVLSGRLSGAIELGHGVHLDKKGSSISTSRVDRIYRTWKTWHIETGSSIYEVLPIL
ncbi:hypothetical protein IJG78_02615 [Candidatus Saccharibacteria bacterium]|nr:hypothetical protein [Candidatus Saccharibacteria bacterium]